MFVYVVVCVVSYVFDVCHLCVWYVDLRFSCVIANASCLRLVLFIGPLEYLASKQAKPPSQQGCLLAVGAKSDRIALAVPSKPETIIMQSNIMSCYAILCTRLFVRYYVCLMCVIYTSDVWICVFRVLLHKIVPQLRFIHMFRWTLCQPASQASQPARQPATACLRAVGAKPDRIALVVPSKPGTIVVQSNVMSCYVTLCMWVFVRYWMYLMCVIYAPDVWVFICLCVTVHASVQNCRMFIALCSSPAQQTHSPESFDIPILKLIWIGFEFYCHCVSVSALACVGSELLALLVMHRLPHCLALRVASHRYGAIWMRGLQCKVAIHICFPWFPFHLYIPPALIPWCVDLWFTTGLDIVLWHLVFWASVFACVFC